jgi:3-oxoacyl-(acyl-carrier-protein) synthase
VIAFVAAAGRWVSPAFEPADEAIAAWAAATLAEVGAGADALCVATFDAGGRESTRFWQESLATGLVFANPRPFPWTLSNSVTGRIAQELGIRGPAFTTVGRADALTAALQHALDELECRRARRPLVAALDAIGVEQTRLAAAALVGATEVGALAEVTAATRPAPETIVAAETASETLATMLDRLERGEPAATGSERDGWVEFRPQAAG